MSNLRDPLMVRLYELFDNDITRPEEANFSVQPIRIVYPPAHRRIQNALAVIRAYNTGNYDHLRAAIRECGQERYPFGTRPQESRYRGGLASGKVRRERRKREQEKSTEPAKP